MDSRFAETARDGGPARPFTPTASPVDARWDASPTMTMSPDTPSSVGSRISDYCDFEHQDHEFLPAFKPQTTSYEVEATVPSKTTVNSGFTANQPHGAPRGLFDRSRDLCKEQAGKFPSHSVARPNKNVGETPATAIHHSKATDAIKKNRRSTDKETGGDPFLGTGKSMRRSSISSVTMRPMNNPPSPSPARIRSSQLGGTLGLLSLHDAHDEVVSLLDKLKTKHRNQTKNDVDAALRRCQDDLKARAKDKNTGTSESNILDREAVRIGRVRDEANRQTPKAHGAASPSTGEHAEFEESLRLALTGLVEDSRAALEAVAQAKNQAASASRATSGYVPYRAGEDFRLTALNLENRTLEEQTKSLRAEIEQLRRLQAEIEHAHKENENLQRRNSDLQKRLDRQLDELKAYRRDDPFEDKLGPWGKDWNIDSRRGG